MTLHLPALTQLLALVACLLIGAFTGWLLLGLSTAVDFTLDCWWSYDVAPRLLIPCAVLGAAAGVWFWVAILL